MPTFTGRRIRWSVSLLVGSLALVASTACGSDGGGPAGDTAVAGERPLVVVTTSILGDVLGRALGRAADVEALIPDGASLHDAQPSAQQRARIARADLVVAVGLGMELGYRPALADAASEGVRVLEVGAALDPLPVGDEHDDDGEGGVHDPHVWLDPQRLALVPEMVADALLEERPDLDAVVLRASAGAEHDALLALDGEIERLVAQLGPAQRRLVTDHEVLGYFADRYGFEVIGAVIPSLGGGAEASAGDLARLAELVQREQIPAIFTEAADNDDLAQALADEVGSEVEVVQLRLESLGDADSWHDVLRADARAIVEALS